MEHGKIQEIFSFPRSFILDSIFFHCQVDESWIAVHVEVLADVLISCAIDYDGLQEGVKRDALVLLVKNCYGTRGDQIGKLFEMGFGIFAVPAPWGHEHDEPFVSFAIWASKKILQRTVEVLVEVGYRRLYKLSRALLDQQDDQRSYPD